MRGLGVDLTRAAIGSVLAAGGIDEAERNRLLQGPMPVPEPITTSAPATAAEPLPTNAPLFSKAADDYYRLRVGQAGGEAAAGGAVQTIKQRCAAFIDILGDRPVDQYKPSDIQDFVFRLG